MKKILFVVFITFCQSMLMGENCYEVSFEEYSGIFKLRLPYESDRKLSRIFREDATLALEIQAMYVDDEEIFRQSDGILGELEDYRALLRTRWVLRRKTRFISMTWLKSTYGEKGIIGNDLKGWGSESYIIYEGSKELLIHYKVIAPFRDMTWKRIIQKDVPDDAYIGEYWAKADLTEVFASF